jgi:capsular polysaccharide biosynthesis protein
MDEDPRRSVSLAVYSRTLRRRWGAIVAGLALGVMLGAAFFTLGPKQYTGQSAVLVNPITADPFDTGPVNQQVSGTTEAVIMRSLGVAERAASLLGTDSDPRDLLKNLQVEVPLNALTLIVRYSGDSATAAADGANAFGRAYLQYRRELFEPQRAAIVENLRKETDGLRAELKASKSGTDASRLTAERLASAQDRLAKAVAISIRPGELVSEARPPRAPSSPTPVTATAGGLVVGLLLAAAMVLYRHRTDDRLTTVAEVEHASGLPALGLLSRDGRSRADAGNAALVVHRLLEHPGSAPEPAVWLFSTVDGSPDTRAGEVAQGMPDGPLRVLTPQDGRTEGVLTEAAGPDPIVVDGARLGSSAALLAWARRADCVVPVVHLGTTTRTDLAAFLAAVTEGPGGHDACPGILVVDRPVPGRAHGPAAAGRAEPSGTHDDDSAALDHGDVALSDPDTAPSTEDPEQVASATSR